MEHLSQEQLDALVMGTESRDEEAIRRHLATCETCARRLVRAAQLESDLYDVAANAPGTVAIVRSRPAAAWTWWVALPVAAALTVAAFGTWYLMSPEKPGNAPPRSSRIRAPSADTPDLAGSRSPISGVGGLSPQDVCRCVTVERIQGPPSDPGSGLCTGS